MNDHTKIGASHLSRAAYVYLRQSTAAQVERNRESTQRQYALAARATALGWSHQQVVTIDEDLGVSGSGIVERSGFARLTAEVALRHVGIVFGLEVSRLARNNALVTTIGASPKAGPGSKMSLERAIISMGAESKKRTIITSQGAFDWALASDGEHYSLGARS